MYLTILAEYYTYIMPYKKESGAQGRKRRKIETEQQAKLAGILHRFLVSTAEITAGPSAAPQETHNPDPVSVDIPVPALEAETVSSKDVYTQPNLPENIEQKVYTDIGYWPETMDETLKTELVRRGTEELQNKDAWFPRDSNGRSFSKDWFYIHLENVLTEVNYTQIYLQQEGLALDQCVQKLKALALFCHEKRDSLVSKATEKALQVCKTYCILTERRVGRRKKMDGENSCDAGLTLIQETSREQLEAIDQLQAEIKKRTTQMNTLHQRFAFLQIQTLLDTGKDDFIKKQIQHTCAQYTELNAASMLTEITRLRHHIILYKEVNPDEQVANWSALDLLRWVYKWKLQESLTNFVVTLRIFLTITVSTASCERSFSKLKLIKTCQRSTMSQERLSNLAILSIERDFNVDFNSVVENFALIKSRRI
ncbi:hypothetical protein NDU88_003359 [Pleurodeles waltl]|uniref:HAT C-terminal dimerisation domain-containing protein n=1 Tax=Pleurodeles waltl TaxID=8319 RepID=A0AAV7LIB3_PLEWA|nr:hypothetical protein NDU88_003359 [Pleurodeles waltl]